MNTKVTSPANLGQTLRSVRMQKNMSQADTGALVGLDQPNLSKIERGESNVRIDTLFRLLAALDMELIIRPREQATSGGDTW